MASKQAWKQRYKGALLHIDRLISDYEAVEQERDVYRAQIEALTSSPEIKADTESAYSRGQELERQKTARILRGVAVDLMETATSLDTEQWFSIPPGSLTISSA